MLYSALFFHIYFVYMYHRLLLKRLAISNLSILIQRTDLEVHYEFVQQCRTGAVDRTTAPVFSSNNGKL